MDDVVVVATQDAILMSRHADCNALKKLVAKLKNAALYLTERSVPAATLSGASHLLDVDANHRVRRVVVGVGERLSLSPDRHQVECWVVVRGVGLIERSGS